MRRSAFGEVMGCDTGQGMDGTFGDVIGKAQCQGWHVIWGPPQYLLSSPPCSQNDRIWG